MARVSTQRRRGEAREAILDVARREFAAHGYRDVGVKDLAASAQVSATLIYRYFGSKAQLFEETIVGPGRAFVAAFLDDWTTASPGADRDAVLEDFVRRLFVFTTDHRGLMEAWGAAMRSPDVLADGSHGLGVRSVAAVLLDHQDDRGEPEEAEALVVCASAVVLALVTMEDVLLPATSPLRDPDLLVETAVRFVLAGATASLPLHIA